MIKLFSFLRIAITAPIVFAAVLVVLFLVILAPTYKLRRFIEILYFRFSLWLFNFRFKLNRKINDEGVIIVANHSSYTDILLCHTLFEGSFIAKKELKYWPLWGWGACLLRTIFIERTGFNAIDSFLKVGKEALAKKMNVILFPEGTTSTKPLKSFRIGAFRLAFQSNAKIVPVIINYRDLEEIAWVDKMNFIPHLLGMLGGFKLRRVILTVLEKLDPANFDDDKQMRDFTRKLMQRAINNESLQKNDVTLNEIFDCEAKSQKELVQTFSK
ncbi:MAG: 1-acyl-sn-glycerol-3-phosphate acyltransferase [Planctomycetes bacterium]|nr:1-acyl-sn-glycerol-3-phosphate acyltransferase [Planctomycetota bacterium]